MAELVPKELLDRVVATYAPRRVILFGSRARGDAREDSDIDLVVVLDDDAPAEALAWERSAQAQRGHRGNVDILPWRESDLRRREHIRGSLAATIGREGVTVYEDATEKPPPPLREEELVTARDEAAECVRRARNDRRMTGLALDLDEPDVENAAFHAQQAAEKFLKALMILADREVPKSHRLDELARRLGDPTTLPPDLAAALAPLTSWAFSGRYPDLPDSVARPDAAVRAALPLLDRLEAITADALAKAG